MPTKEKSPKLSLFEKLLVLVGKNYWGMTDHELELQASRFKIGEYVKQLGGGGNFTLALTKVSRKRIIEQLVFRDKFISSFVSLVVAVIALIISIIALLK